MRLLVILSVLTVLASVATAAAVKKTRKSTVNRSEFDVRALLDLIQKYDVMREAGSESGSGSGSDSGEEESSDSGGEQSSSSPGWTGASWTTDESCAAEGTRDKGYDPKAKVAKIAESVECGERQDDRRSNLLNELLEYLLERDTGKPIDQENKRIVGGVESEYGQWPWLAAIGKKDVGQDCGAALIAKRWIVTAAHCFKTEMEKTCEWNVRLGEHSLTGSAEKHIDFTPEKIIIHPNYDLKADHDDIALIKLSEDAPIAGNDYVNTICIPTKDEDFGDKCFGSGWGDIANNAGNYPDKVRHVELPLIDQKKCQKLLGKDYAKGMMCAGYLAGGKDTCSGDSGGPLVCQQEDGSFVQAGVVSWGKGCAQKNSPGVYSDLRVYLHWVESVITRNP